MSGAYTPVKNKCIWWRELPIDEDTWNTRVPEDDKRVYCSCFIEGQGWVHPRIEVPHDCPDSRRCRYYIRHT